MNLYISGSPIRIGLATSRSARHWITSIVLSIGFFREIFNSDMFNGVGIRRSILGFPASYNRYSLEHKVLLAYVRVALEWAQAISCRRPALRISNCVGVRMSSQRSR